MAYLDHNEAYEDFKGSILSGIRDHFPVEGKKQVLELEDLDVKEGPLGSDDIKAQKKAKLEGETWAAPVYANLALRNKETGDVVERKKVKVAGVPKVTRRYSYIVDGQEYQVDNQWRLRPGVYTRRRQSGELESQFNIPNRTSFKLTFNPENKKFLMDRGKSKAIPMYPVMKAMGVSDEELEKTWGSEILAANRSARGVSTALEKVFKADRKRAPKSLEEAKEHLFSTMAESELRPESTDLTLGKKFTNVNGDTLHRATKKILQVQAGAPEDDRDSLVFKDLRTASDFAKEKLTAYQTKKSLKLRMGRKIDRATGVRELIPYGGFDDPIRQTFHKNAAARVADQINPVEMLAAAQQTTIMGPGGIQSENAIMDEAKFINPSHLGYLDPIKTPEGSKTGVTLRLPMGVRKVGKESKIPLYNIKTKRMEYVAPGKFSKSSVVMPDQVDWKDGSPVPVGKKVKMSGRGNDLTEGSISSADYVMRSPSQMFNLTTNLVPFLKNTSGNRATYAGQHIEQSISLLNREEPLVQVGTGADKEGLRTFEELVGRQASHPSPVSGKIVKVGKSQVTVQDKAGEKHDVQLYDNFPLNDAKSVLHSYPLVKEGDVVKQDQNLADTNFTKGGKLALGANLRTAYVPYKGYNFEDGVVISDTAAKKMSSVHMHKPSMKVSEDAVSDIKKFRNQHPEAFDEDQYKKIGENGVVAVGQEVTPGDPLVVAMRPFNMRDRMDRKAVGRSLSGAHTDVSMRWEGMTRGKVVGVNRKGAELQVHVRTIEPIQEGDKIAGRYGNKGIIAKVLPDKDMPHTKDGTPMEVLMNPSGVPGRMNAGQMFETAASKIAEKTGKPYIVQNFSRGDTLTQLKADMQKHKVSDTEELIDPTSGVSLGKALAGKQHVLKLAHQVEKKIAARGGMQLAGSTESPEGYDLNLIPSGGSKTGGQSMGNLGMSALLAHGAHANIREIQTFKSEGEDPQPNEAKRHRSQHIQIWSALQTGEPMPTPQPTFAFRKFQEMMRGAGVNMEKQGNDMILTPRTDKQVLGMSSGELPKPAQLTYSKIDPKTGEPKVIPGGLFDDKLTGGHGGRKWTHMKLAEPMPNPLYEGAVQKLTGMKAKDYDELVRGQKAMTKDGALVALGTENAKTGGPAIKQLLDKIDVQKMLPQVESQLANASFPKEYPHKGSTQKVDGLVKKVKYLRALDKAGVSASDAYMMNNLPVLPPSMRPASVLPDGNVKWADLNELYSGFAQVNEQLRKPSLQQHLSDKRKKNLRADVYDGLRAVVGMGTHKEGEHRGILDQIHGSSPKRGFFQKTLLSRRQDLSMRSVITPEPSLGLDEVGLPRDKAMTLYRPFIIKNMVDTGAAKHPLEAQEMVAKKHDAALDALSRVAEERPVLLKRDPALHKHSVQAFKPRITAGRSIKIHPLTVSGYNADFDGDTMSVYVPVHPDAVDEAKKMTPSNNLFSDATGRVIYQPSLESAVGLYKLSRAEGTGKKKFINQTSALKAAQQGRAAIDEVVTVGKMKTTPGRILLASAVPSTMQKKVLTDLNWKMDKKGMDQVFTDLAKNHKGEFGTYANELKDLGNGASFGAVKIPGPKGPDAIKAAESKKFQYISMPTHTLSLDDVDTDKRTRDKHLNAAQKVVDQIQKSVSIPARDKERRTVEVWTSAAKKMVSEHQRKMEKKPTNLYTMFAAGQKPKSEQYQQMVMAPVLVKDSSNRIIPKPIKHSYSEGLDSSEYWTQMAGARRGTVLKVQEVQEPGYFTKQLMNTSMNLVVKDEDCGTKRGISLPVGGDDVYDRELAADVKFKGMNLRAGQLMTPDLVGKVRAVDKSAQLVVRSPLKCEHGKGMCRKCAGLSGDGSSYQVGTNVGVLATQALGERAVQLTLKQFHSGGVATGGGSKLINAFARTKELTELPEKIPDATPLAMRGGTIEKIERDPTGVQVFIGGKAHHIGRDRAGMPLNSMLPSASKVDGYRAWKPPRVGMKVAAGQVLGDPNRTNVNPHDLYKATNNIEHVQNFLVDELHGMYKDEGVRRQHVETVVRAMSDLTKVRDPGDAPDLLRGEFTSRSKVRALNTQLAKSGKKPTMHSPVLAGINVTPLQVQEDWMAKLNHQLLKRTVAEAASTGARSSIHGIHPVPAMAYGAEFGLNTKHSLRPGLQHLQKVPRYAY